jgi:putative transcriptional regulator
VIGSGDILVAPPQMRDTRFSQSVILIIHAGDDGHWGLCLNKSMRISIGEMLNPVGLEVDLDPEIYWGGPVNQGVIWMLHDTTWRMPATIDLSDQWAMTSHKNMFDLLAKEGLPDHWRMFSGFSAWGPGQLEAEIEGSPPWTKNSSWLICHGFDPAWAFDQDGEDLWRSSISLSGQQAVSSWL